MGLGLVFVSAGAAERNRTVDLRITNALLYQLSYSGTETFSHREVGILSAKNHLWNLNLSGLCHQVQ